MYMRLAGLLIYGFENLGPVYYDGNSILRGHIHIQKKMNASTLQAYISAKSGPKNFGKYALSCICNQQVY